MNLCNVSLHHPGEYFGVISLLYILTTYTRFSCNIMYPMGFLQKGEPPFQVNSAVKRDTRALHLNGCLPHDQLLIEATTDEIFPLLRNILRINGMCLDVACP